MSEYDFEPIRGLPGHLPAGEKLLWQDAPDWTRLALSAFHVRKIAIYFGLLLAWRGFIDFQDGASVQMAAQSALWLSLLGGLAIGLVSLLAWFTARTTVYSITSRRLIIRFGIALPMTINLPFQVIDTAALKLHADGSGDIPLALTGSDRVAYLVLWPHVRPWRLTRPQPMLRAVSDAVDVAEILAHAIAGVTEGTCSVPQRSAAARDKQSGQPQPLTPALSG